MILGFIGAGNIAGAIVSGVIKNSICSCESIYAYDIFPDKLDMFCSEHNINPSSSINALVGECDIIVLSVKPQNYSEVLGVIARCDVIGKTFVSVAAGISISYIKGILGNGTKVVRVMPNTPLLLGKGATALCRDDIVTDCEFSDVCSLFECGGKTSVLDESHMNSVIAVNGSSPAYLFLFARAVCKYAENVGIDAQTAKELFAQTMVGSAAMLNESGDDIDTLIAKVTSKGGTTAKALEVFENEGFEDCIIHAMEACTKRADELGN